MEMLSISSFVGCGKKESKPTHSFISNSWSERPGRKKIGRKMADFICHHLATEAFYFEWKRISSESADVFPLFCVLIGPLASPLYAISVFVFFLCGLMCFSSFIAFRSDDIGSGQSRCHFERQDVHRSGHQRGSFHACTPVWPGQRPFTSQLLPFRFRWRPQSKVSCFSQNRQRCTTNTLFRHVLTKLKLFQCFFQVFQRYSVIEGFLEISKDIHLVDVSLWNLCC